MKTRPSEFGPQGYLPERAAKRARKIVLRGRMGLGWPLAAVGAALVVAVAGIAFLTGVGREPAAPFAPVTPIAAVDPAAAAVVSASGSPLLVVRGGGPVRVFDPPGAAVAWCAASGRLEGGDGRVWTADGTLVGGAGASLQPRRSVVFDGVLYADRSTTPPAPPPRDRDESPAC